MLGFKTVVEASYVGAYGRHPGERRNINSIPDGSKFVDCGAGRPIPVSIRQPQNWIR